MVQIYKSPHPTSLPSLLPSPKAYLSEEDEEMEEEQRGVDDKQMHKNVKAALHFGYFSISRMQVWWSVTQKQRGAQEEARGQNRL